MKLLFAFLLAATSHVSSSFLWKRLPQNASTPTDQNLKDVFNDTARSNMWGSSETISGHGSELDVTAPVRKCLGHWIKKYSIQVLVDCPCGDANWQGHVPGIDKVQYHGYDIADLPLERARRKNAGTSMKFEHLDLSATVPLVRGDLILVRDVIQHLPLDKGISFLQNAKASGAKYIAVTSFTDGVNTGSPPGGFYKNNVHAHPFSMPRPLETCQNYAQSGVATKWHPTDFLELIDLAAWQP